MHTNNVNYLLLEIPFRNNNAQLTHADIDFTIISIVFSHKNTLKGYLPFIKNVPMVHFEYKQLPKRRIPKCQFFVLQIVNYVMQLVL